MGSETFTLETLFKYCGLPIKLEGPPTDEERDRADIFMQWDEEQYPLARKALFQIKPSKRLTKVLRLWRRPDSGTLVLGLLVFSEAALEKLGGLAPSGDSTKGK